MDKKIFDFINRYLDNEIYEIPVVDDYITVKVKLKLTGEKQMISVGKWTDYLTYSATIFLDDEGNRIDGLAEKLMFKGQTHIEFKSYELTHIYFFFSRKCNEVLTSVLDLFNVDKEVIMTEIIKDNYSNLIKESVIKEGKFDGITRDLVRDIITVFKKENDGKFTLPEYFMNDIMVYDFKTVEDPFTLDLEIIPSTDIEDIEVDGDYSRYEDIISVEIKYNPNNKITSIQKLIGELNEIVRHELEHVNQKQKGYKFRKSPEKSFKYYTMKREIEAQVAGFRRRAKKERRPVEEVMREWFQKYKEKHNLTSKEIDKVIKRLLSKFT